MPQTLHCVILYSENFHHDDQKAAKKAGIESLVIANFHYTDKIKAVVLDVNRFYPKTQLSWLARLDHSHCNSADPLTDGLEVCCVFYRPGPGGAMCVVWWWKVLESRGRGGMRHGGVGGRGGAVVAG